MDRAAELHGGWLWTRGGASPRGETWRRRWFTLVRDGRGVVLEFRATQNERPLARLALTPTSGCERLVGAEARRASPGNCPAGVVLRITAGPMGATRLVRASTESAVEGWVAAMASAATNIESPAARRASQVAGELERLSARRREMERVDDALRRKSDRLDRRVRALRDRTDTAPGPPGYVVATPPKPRPPAPPEATPPKPPSPELEDDVTAAAALCARTEAAARDVVARTAALGEAERALSCRLDAAVSASADVADDGEDDAPFSASTLLEALEVLAARRGALVSRAVAEQRSSSRVEAAWLETLRAEVVLLDVDPAG